MTTHNGTSGNDVIDGGNGTDSIYGLGGDDIIYGGNGADALLDGGAGDDQLFGENGNDHLVGREGDDLVDGNNGFDIVYYSGLIKEYTFLASAGYLHILHGGGAGADGHDRVIRVERLVFADRVINLGSGKNVPVAVDDHALITEDTGLYNSGALGVLANDFDFDGDAMTVTAGTFTGAYGTLTLNSDGTYGYAQSGAAQALALGQVAQDSFTYTVTDNDGSTTGTLIFHIAGLNDAPTANPDSGSGDENQILTVDVLANDTDVDNGAVLSVTAASAPAGKGSASVADNQLQFDPGTDFDHLAAGATETVVLSYTVSDEHGATSTSTVTITVTGTNDDPVASPDTAAGAENQILTIDALANDSDVDDGAVKTLVAVSAGKGSASIVADRVEFDPGTDFDHLAEGATEEVVLDYAMQDEHGSSSSSTVTITVTGANDGPEAIEDSADTSENASVTIDVVANDSDVDDGAVLSVTTASAPSGKGSASVVANQLVFDPGDDFDHLASGATEVVVLSYTVSDEHGATSSSTVSVTVTGTNDGPVANPDTAATGENTPVTIDVLANDTDADDGAVLTVTSASAPAGQGTASVVGNKVVFNPGTDFDDLAIGGSETVTVTYGIADEHGATSSSTITITVTRTNDGPVANPDVKTTSENSAVVIDVIANDTDADNNAVLTVVAASGPAGQGTVSIVENQVRFDPGTDFDYLASGETATVTLSYTIQDEHGASASSTVTVTVQGRDEGVSNTGTEDSDTLTGTPGDDEIDALGGDDNVYGLAGDDLLIGGNGSDFLSGDEDDDTLQGGNDDDFLSGGDGNDQIAGEAGNDTAAGENGSDQLSGGDGLDLLSGGAGDDVIEGGNHDDFLFGDDDNDQLSGQAGADILSGDAGDDELSGGTGNDSLDGGEGDDSLDGGDGDDYLSGGLGANSLNGGLGQDQIVANSSGGAQTIDGGGGNDTIRLHSRSTASTITTGTGSDSIEIAHADVGTAAIVVTDFTAGAGGDVFRLSGDDGSSLSLLSGWDGGSNPFGAGFLRLEQDGSDTLLQWNQDGAGSDWETLVVFENSNAGAFTEANFEPAYHPDGSALGGQSITGTAESDALTGTFGDDTIDALAGDDSVSGLAGADIIHGGDGFDSLSGGDGGDVIDGGNDADFVFGGRGDDQLSGDGGDDILFGELGSDQLLGGAGDDSLDGSDGDDTLDGGDGQDFLSGGLGENVLDGGLGDDMIVADSTDGAQTIDGGDGNDTLRHYYRSSASTISTGGGVDTIELRRADVGSAAILVSDFTPGAGGDRFELSGGDDSLLGLLSGWDGGTNPFGAGFLRLQQDGDDTLFQWDRDGAEGGSGWETLAVLQNTDVADFTDANFLPAYHPGGDPPAGETITGTNGDDSLTGTLGDDSIDALGGDDSVSGLRGNDGIRGGDGSDFLHGDGGSDVLEGGNQDDRLWGGDGNDQLLGEAGDDILAGEAGDDSLSGGDGNNSLDGGDGDDTLEGGSGQDYLFGGSGADVMTGGLGADLFDFKSVSDGPDEITDFAGGSDRIRIWSNGFEGGLSFGGSVSLVSGSDPAATEESGQFLYDTDDGSLYWDADGTGEGGAVLIATFTSIPSLEASDFIVI